MALDLANIKSITTKSGVTIKRAMRKSDGKILWSADVPDVTYDFTFNYSKEQTYYDTGVTTTVGTVITIVDKSQYSGIELTLTGVELNTAYQWSDAYLYLTDGVTNVEIAHMSLNADDEPYQERVNLITTLSFTDAIGMADLYIVLYTEEMNEVAYTVTGGTVKLIGRKG